MRSQWNGGWSAITKVKGMNPEIFIVARGQRTHDLEARNAVCALGECTATCRGSNPWQVIQRITSELGRAIPFPIEASNKLKKQGGCTAVRQSDQLIVEE